MQIAIVKLSPEEEELMSVRAGALICSLTASQKRFEQARAIDEAARALYDESCLLETESDDWETAHAAVEKQDRIEQEFIAAAPVRHNALLRLGWEMREAQKAGIAITI